MQVKKEEAKRLVRTPKETMAIRVQAKTRNRIVRAVEKGIADTMSWYIERAVLVQLDKDGIK